MTSKEDALLQYRFTEWFTAHLTDLTRRFDGDVYQALTLTIVGQVTLRRYIDFVPVGGSVIDYPYISASRIADSIGAPRETIRRKLILLEQRGCIERDQKNGWRLRGMATCDPEANCDICVVSIKSLDRLKGLMRAVKVFE